MSTTTTVTSTVASILSTSTPAPSPTDRFYVGASPQYEAYRAQVRNSIASALTPLNLTLLVLLFTLAYFRLLRPYNATQQVLNNPPPGASATVFQTFTPRTLLKFNGQPSEPFNPQGKVYLAVKGKVHDVTSGRNFYGPGGPYENFAGRDATRGLACQSFDDDMLTQDLDGPLDDCADLDQGQLENLKGWQERFDEKVSFSVFAIFSMAVRECVYHVDWWHEQSANLPFQV